MKKRIWLRIALAGILVLIIGSFAYSAEIKLGVVFPMSGEGKEDGLYSLLGVQLANEDYPKIDGYDIKLIVKDDNTDPKKSAELVKELASEGVIALIGWPWSGLALGAAPVAEELKIPMVCTWATNPKVTEGRKYVSRTAFIDTFGGKIIATFLVKEKGIKKVAILQDTKQPYSTGLAEISKKEIEALGGTAKIYSTETGASPQNIAKVIDEIVKSNPEAVVLTVYSREAAMSLALLKEKGFKGLRMMGDTGGSPSLWEMSGGAVDGLYFYDHFHPAGAQTGVAKRFVEEFKKKYNKEPYAAAAVAYDAYLIVYNAIKNCLKDGKKLTRENVNYYIRHTKDLEGTTGKITIDPKTGDPSKPAFLIQWKGNKTVFLKLITP